jgi:hypothetical protein
MGKRIAFVAVIAIIAVGAYLFLFNDDNGDDNSTELPDPETLMETAADNLESAETFQMELRQSGTRTRITEVLDNPIYFDRADAVFESPDKLGGQVNVLFGEIAAEVGLRIIGTEQFLKSPILTADKWQTFTLAAGFNGGDLLSAEKGISTALVSIQNPEMVGRDEIDSIPVYHVRGQVDAKKVASITVGLINTQDGMIDIDVFVRTRDSFPAQIVLTEPPVVDDEGTPMDATVWTVNFFGYNRDDLGVSQPEDVVESDELLGAGEDDDTDNSTES